jgi:hypothetical protein
METQKFDIRVANEKAKARAKLACDELNTLGVDVRWLLGAVVHPNLFFVIVVDKDSEQFASVESALSKHRLHSEFYSNTLVKVYGY